MAPTAAPAAAVEVDELPVVRAREREFEQLFANLLGNAAKFVAPGTRPRIAVHAARRGRSHWRRAGKRVRPAAPLAERVLVHMDNRPCGRDTPAPG